jgi:predicted DNA-binding protein YlxM (UPF0122 family)
VSTIAHETTIDDHALADIAEAVGVAREAILEQLKSAPGTIWRPRQLIDAAKNVIADGKISKTIVSIAFWNMVDGGELNVDEQLIVHAVHLV